jgi:RNA polymerase sigma-70 factor (ECF subfamily)
MGSWIGEHQEERELVARARYGDLSAFDVLVARYRPGALVLARQVVRPVEVAEDAVQDAFLAAFKALPQLADPDKFAAWLGSIVRHRARRLAAGDRPVPVPLDVLILHHTPSLSDEVEQRVGSQAIRCALRDLSGELRPIMELYYVEEWSVNQISSFLALPVSTVKWRLHSGRVVLRRSLFQLMEESNESGK